MYLDKEIFEAQKQRMRKKKLNWSYDISITEHKEKELIAL